MRASRLARYLFAVYLLLVVYASLYPLAGWRVQGVEAFAFLSAPWPRYVTAFDLLSNVLAYAPYGFLCVLALHPALRGRRAVFAAIVSGVALSILLEAAQSYLAARVASNLDVLSNAAGAAVGALASMGFAPWLLGAGPLQALRARAFLPGAQADFGLVLLGLWLFAQLNPAMLLFGSGDLRDLLTDPAGPAHPPALFVSIEAVTAAANLVAVALLASAVVAPAAPARAVVVLLVLAALAVRAFAFAILMGPGELLVWLTPGARQGLVAGLALALLLLALPRTLRLALAAVLLMAATVLVNLAPSNPYLAATLKVWQQGHFLNFNGLTRLVSSTWPFIALGYLMLLASRRQTSPG